MSADQEGAFGRYYRENLQGLRGYIARLMPGSCDTDDIANEVFTRVFAASTEERPVPPKAYLFAAAHNAVMNHHRGLKVRRVLHPTDGNTDNLVDDAPDVERCLIAQERVDLLWEAIDQLPARTRQVFIMRKVEQLKNPEIAEELGISVSAVEKHIRNGLRICRAYLDKAEGQSFETVELTEAKGMHHG